MPRRHRALLAPLALGLAGAAAGQDATGPSATVDFAADVRPLLSDRCFPCHGPDAASLTADLRLDRRDDALADRGGYAAIVAGDPAASELVRRITHANDRRRMPPPESKLTLAPDEVELLRRWIDEGAPYEEHWSFTPPRRRLPEELDAGLGPVEVIDVAVGAGLDAVDLELAPEADPGTLLRRASYALAGLPPTVQELDAFLADARADRYERAVERLLESPAHAERMAAHWLDVARYADTFGYQSDVDMNVWPWRDWVLRAFASNLPYDDFVVQQLAGDLLPGATPETRLATTFNRLHRQTNEGGSVEEEFRVEYVCDRVETMAGAFLGLTVGCARCHDHKFDPVSQRDYFGLFAFFDGIDESGLYSHFTNAVPTPALDLATDEQAARLVELDASIAAAEAALAAAPRSDATPLRVSPAWTRFDLEPGPEPEAVETSGDPERRTWDRERHWPFPLAEHEEDDHYYRLSGDDAVAFPGAGVFRRSDAFTLALLLRAPTRFERAVVLHRTKSWTDSGSRGYQLLIEDGRLSVALVHFWPGDAIAIRATEELAVGEWTHVAFTYDGSSRAAGLRLWVDGEPAETEVVRDHLTRTIRGGSIGHLALGSRFRDRGFKGGDVDDVVVVPSALAAEGIERLALGEPPLELASPARDAGLEALRALRAERDALRDGVRQVMTMREGPVDVAGRPGAERQAYVLRRGEYSQPTDPVGPATPAFLPTLLETPARTRLDLARWLVHPDHPLTARVHVDRLWRLVFGQGLLPTPEDLGSQSPAPRHLALLDELALDLVESGWDSRALLRRMVLSRTFRQTSTAGADALARDPANERFSRAPGGRLAAEMIRDGALHAAGLLALRTGGPPVMPYQPPGLWQEKSGKVYRPGRGEDLYRRSLYTFWRRTSPPPTLAMFDAPSREVCRVARPATTTPLQALALWNDPQFVAAAVALGRRAAALGDDAARVRHLFLAATARPPTAAEEAAFVELLAAQRTAYRADPDAARALAAFDLERVAHPPAEDAPAGETPAATPLADDDAVERAATAVAASAALSLDDALTRR